MIVRDYLKYESARQYVDRGMVKWMGFFISEHTSALLQMGNEIDFSKKIKEEEILMLLGQVYLNNLEIALYTNENYKPYIGKIIDMENSNIYFRTEVAVKKILCKNIIRLKLLENESWMNYKKTVFNLITFQITMRNLRKIFMNL